MGLLVAAKSALNSVLDRIGYAVVRLPGGSKNAAGLSPEARIFHAALNAPGQVSLQESRFLTELAQQIDHAGPIVEIGTLFGKSTLALILGKSPERPLYTVDSYSWNPHGFPPQEHRAITEAVLDEACRDYNVEQVIQDKSTFYDDWIARGMPPPSLVFLDADHSEKATREDIEWAKRVNAQVICGHDYTPNIPGVVKAVDATGGLRKLVGTVWVLEWQPAPESASVS